MRKKKEPVSSFAIDEATGRKALEQFRTGKPLFGKDGAFGPMLQAFLEAALEGELSAHLRIYPATPIYHLRSTPSIIFAPIQIKSSR